MDDVPENNINIYTARSEVKDVGWGDQVGTYSYVATVEVYMHYFFHLSQISLRKGYIHITDCKLSTT